MFENVKLNLKTCNSLTPQSARTQVSHMHKLEEDLKIVGLKENDVLISTCVHIVERYSVYAHRGKESKSNIFTMGITKVRLWYTGFTHRQFLLKSHRKYPPHIIIITIVILLFSLLYTFG